MEPFDFAVGLGSVWAGSFVGDAELGAGVAPGERSVTGAVVGQDSFDSDAVVGEPRDGAVEDADSGFGLLVSTDLDVGDSGVVIDDRVEEGLPGSGMTGAGTLQVAQTITVHHGALAYLLGSNALRASEAAAVRIEDYRETLRGHRVLHLVGKGSKPATMPLTVPVLRVLEACRGERTDGRLILRPLTGNPIDRRDVYRMVQRIARTATIPRHISPHSLRHAAITNALDAGVPFRDAQILARHADPRTTEHYDRARGNLDRHGVHFLTAYVAGV